MPNRKTKPTSPGRRFATYPLREQLTATEPERKLTEELKKSGGRNANGRVTARHRGGGAKRRYRKIDFKRLKDGVPAKVASIEYDPNRTCYIALLHYADGHKDYILAPSQLAGEHAVNDPGRLVVERSKVVPAGKTFDAGPVPVTVGRSSENTIVLDGDEFASGRHARIESQRDGVWLLDLGSTNGIEVNGKRTDRAQLSHDDRILLGRTEVTFEQR